MNQLPTEIKYSVLLAIILMITVVMLLIAIIVLFSRRQILFQKEKKLQDAEYKNQLLQKEVDYQKKAKLEQERISHDMHDDIGAGISAIKLQAEFLKRKSEDQNLENHIDDLLKTCDDLNLSMREMLWNLKAGSDSLLNFTDHLIQYTQSFFGKTNLKVHVVKSEIGEEKMSADMRKSTFLCVKEALNNIYKHSKAENVELHLLQTPQKFSIIIKDDGVGMQKETIHGNGMKNMKWRMSSVCGDFKIIPTEKGLQINFEMDL